MCEASSGGDGSIAGNRLRFQLTAHQVTKEEAAGMAQAVRDRAQQTVDRASRQLGHFEV